MASEKCVPDAATARIALTAGPVVWRCMPLQHASCPDDDGRRRLRAMKKGPRIWGLFDATSALLIESKRRACSSTVPSKSRSFDAGRDYSVFTRCSAAVPFSIGSARIPACLRNTGRIAWSAGHACRFRPADFERNRRVWHGLAIADDGSANDDGIALREHCPRREGLVLAFAEEHAGMNQVGIYSVLVHLDNGEPVSLSLSAIDEPVAPRQADYELGLTRMELPAAN